eukprot:g5798.t1
MEGLGLVCWAGDTTPLNVLELPELILSLLELFDDQLVSLEIIKNAPVAERVILKCVSDEDYQLINYEKDFFEAQILNQGCLVVRDQLLPIWLRHHKLPIMLITLDIQTSTAFAKMTNQTILEVLSSSDPYPGAEEVGDNSQNANSVVPINEGPWLLRLQRPIKELTGMKNLELEAPFVHPTQCPTEHSKISSPLTSCLFLNSTTGTELGLQSGSFVKISKTRPSKKDSKIRVLFVTFINSVSLLHCSVHELIASELELEYCQPVYLSLARPIDFELVSPFTLEIRPVEALLNGGESDQGQSGAPDGAQYLRQVITGVLGMDMFQHNEADSVPPAESFMNSGLITRTKEWAYSLFTPSPVSNDESSKQDSDSVHEIQSGDPLAQFLTNLVLCWINQQLQLIREYQEIQKLPFLSNQLIQMKFQGARTGRFQEKQILFRIDLKVKQEEILDASNGFLLDPDRLRAAIRAHRCHLVLNELQSESLPSPEAFPDELQSLIEPSWLSEIHKECIQYIKPALLQNRRQPQEGLSCGVIISGPKQSAHVYYVPCRKIWNRLKESFSAFSREKLLIFKNISKAAVYQPSIVVLDDLESWSGSDDHLTSQRAMMMIKELMDQTKTTGASIVFLATCADLDQMDNGVLLKSGVFDFHLQLPQLDAAIRSEILTFIFKTNGVQLEINALNNKLPYLSDHWTVRDLERFSQRVVHCSRLKSIEGKLLVTKEDILETLVEFVPASSWTISSSSTKGIEVHSLDDVGGLHEAKEAFHDCIELPMKYPELLSQCPLRLMSNLLLYGPPGSGKTFIVTALAESLSLRLISVKGPELLNKYIGQSEAGVRNVFKRAIEASPCLLFFDEFEALGRHRGSDTSGVADRIVNQLLAEMDGVESLNGICVLAATSRPDLIDKALLRPGRLDKHVFCDLPGIQDRYEILKKTTQKQKIASEVDLRELAERTEGYSGADLASIISEAHLHAIGEILKTQTGSGADDDKTVVVEISAGDIEFAFHQSRPSSTEKEKLFLSQIYYNFSNGKVCISRDNFHFREKGLTYG